MSFVSNLSNNTHHCESDDKKRESLGQATQEAASKLRQNTDRINMKQERSGEGEHQNDRSFHHSNINMPVLKGGEEKGEINDQPTTSHLNSEDAVSQDDVKEIRDMRRKAFGGHDPNRMISVGACREMNPQEAAMSRDEAKEIHGMQTKASGGHDPHSVIRIAACRGMVTSSQEMEQNNSIKRENQEMKAKLKCKMCQAKNADIAFIPCGHLVCCYDCGKNTAHCIFCEEKIEIHVPITDDEQ